MKHSELKAGDPCPACKKGTVYRHSKPTRIVRIRGFAPLQAEVYELEKLRCNLCGKLFTAPVPEGIGEDKYDAESASIIALLKYGSGMPFNRLERLQGNLGIPLPASTQWEIVHEASEAIDPVYRAMIGLAAQGKLLHHDDTTMKILKAVSQDSDRKGVFTTGVVSVLETGQRILSGNYLMELKVQGAYSRQDYRFGASIDLIRASLSDRYGRYCPDRRHDNSLRQAGYNNDR